MTLRIGMLTPSSNTVLEPVTAQLASLLGGQVSVHFSRFPVTVIDNSEKTHDQFGLRPMLSAAALLADAKVDAIVWNGTSGAWEGLERDHELVGALEKKFGVPATTTSLALIQLMKSNRLRTYGLVVPYVDAIVEKIKTNLAAEGLVCLATSNDRLTDNFSFATVEPETIASHIRRVAAEHPQAVVVHCTNLRGADVADAMARELRLPVLDSVVVTFWGALSLLGEHADLPGLQGLRPRAANV